jgi:lipoprotein-anchoring transpeptidase ErfK/SrfK
MKFSILVVVEWGVYIHEWVPGASIVSGGTSHGCIHLDTGNAENVYNWVDAPVVLTISYPWPGP